MSDYYFLLTSLPNLELFSKPPIAFNSLFTDLEMNLSDKDIEEVRKFTRFFDILNLKAFWQKKPLDPWGNLDSMGLDEALLVETVLPEYIFDYIKKYPNEIDRIKYFPELLSYFFSNNIENGKGFFKKYFTFQKTIRLFVTVLRAGQEKEELEKQLFFEDLRDIDIQDIIKKTDTYEDVDFDYRPLCKILKNKTLNPLVLYKKFMEFQYYALDRLMIEHPFSLDQLLGYIAKLRIITELSSLDEEKGKQVASQIA